MSTTTLSDAKSTHYDGAVHYTPRITSLTDYYPFGAGMPGRGFSASNYRYGFQGQEKDDELKGEGNSINYKYRMHDARIGRFFAVDPLAASFPWNSSYAFSENRVVDGKELEGLEFVDFRVDQKVKSNKATTEEDIIGAQIIAGFTPLGPLVDLWDLAMAIMEGDPIDIGTSLAGFLPFGDFAKLPKKFKKLTQSAADAERIKNGAYASYKAGTDVFEFTTESNEEFVRFFSSKRKNAEGKWMMKKSDLLDNDGNMLSAEEIQNRYSLSYVPDRMITVNIPKGTNMRAGTAAEVEKHSTLGGGRQFEVIDDLPSSSYDQDSIQKVGN